MNCCICHFFISFLLSLATLTCSLCLHFSIKSF
nr:MAG TPA: hypothetical protein [Caudoviricetes sp.]